jgi:hypothetical protein
VEAIAPNTMPDDRSGFLIAREERLQLSENLDGYLVRQSAYPRCHDVVPI